MPIITKQPEWTKELSDKDLSSTIKTQLILGWNIYHRRKYRWLSQSELATKAGITQSIVSDLEWWDYNPSVEMLSRLADVLWIKIELLIREDFNRRFFEALNYFVSKLKEIDILKLMKLIYFSDLEFNNTFWRKFTWMKYYRWHAWPFNSDIYSATKFFKKNEEHFENTSNIAKNVALIDDDIKFLNKIIEKYWTMSSTEIRDKSYETKPMEWCKKTNTYKMGEFIF